jgi:hypothetical protein
MSYAWGSPPVMYKMQPFPGMQRGVLSYASGGEGELTISDSFEVVADSDKTAV